MTCAQEALALANRFACDRRYYDWLLLSEDGQPVTSWNGVQVGVDDALIVCAGGECRGRQLEGGAELAEARDPQRH